MSYGGGGSMHNSKELNEKLLRVTHSLEELKKSYFKKMKEIE